MSGMVKISSRNFSTLNFFEVQSSLEVQSKKFSVLNFGLKNCR